MRITRRHSLAMLLALSPRAARAQAQQRETAPPVSDIRPMPADRVVHHSLELPGRTLEFTSTAGAIRLFDDKNSPLTDLAFIAYQLDGGEPAHRPVTFVFNGGPGFASGWLQVGAVGPWRIPLGGDATVPSASPDPLPNAETWLDFTDLVFIDPAGTGYSRILGNNEEARKRLWSVQGDIDYLAQAIRRWLDKSNRMVSPKYILGESYGGFRAPRLARQLANSEGVGLTGLVLVSPALDIGGRSLAFDPFYFVDRLPTMAAVARAAQGPVTHGQLADVEQYAATDYLLDLTRGERDQQAIERRSQKVAEFTGLDPALVRRYDGMIDNATFLHEFARAQGRIGSASRRDDYQRQSVSSGNAEQRAGPSARYASGTGHGCNDGDLREQTELAS